MFHWCSAPIGNGRDCAWEEITFHFDLSKYCRLRNGWRCRIADTQHCSAVIPALRQGLKLQRPTAGDETRSRPRAPRGGDPTTYEEGFEEIAALLRT
jgi:hypothetical protein